MKDLAALALEDFLACHGQTFVVTREDGAAVELELIEVKPLGTGKGAPNARRAFAALFRGPFDRVLPQRLHQIQNATLGELTLFLVPIGPDERGMLYDATFN